MRDLVSDRWADHALSTLQTAGLRRGGARRAVIGHLAGQPCAVTAQEIEESLHDVGRDVGRASVYRVLDLLVQHRLVQRLEMGEGMARYEVVRLDGEHHHHLVCGRCGRFVPFHDADLERAIESLGTRLGFAVEDHEVVLHGACDRCEEE